MRYLSTVYVFCTVGVNVCVSLQQRVDML